MSAGIGLHKSPMHPVGRSELHPVGHGIACAGLALAAAVKLLVVDREVTVGCGGGGRAH